MWGFHGDFFWVEHWDPKAFREFTRQGVQGSQGLKWLMNAAGMYSQTTLPDAFEGS